MGLLEEYDPGKERVCRGTGELGQSGREGNAKQKGQGQQEEQEEAVKSMMLHLFDGHMTLSSSKTDLFF